MIGNGRIRQAEMGCLWLPGHDWGKKGRIGSAAFFSFLFFFFSFFLFLLSFFSTENKTKNKKQQQQHMSRSTHEFHPLQAPRRRNNKKAEWCEGREAFQPFFHLLITIFNATPSRKTIISACVHFSDADSLGKFSHSSAMSTDGKCVSAADGRMTKAEEEARNNFSFFFFPSSFFFLFSFFSFFFSPADSTRPTRCNFLFFLFFSFSLKKKINHNLKKDFFFFFFFFLFFKPECQANQKQPAQRGFLLRPPQVKGRLLHHQHPNWSEPFSVVFFFS